MKRAQIFRKILCVVLTALLLAVPFCAQAAYTLPEGIEVTARAALVAYLEPTVTTAEEGLRRDIVVYEKDADTPVDPAATVRVMVGLYAMKLIEDNRIDLDTTTGTYTDSLEQNHIWGTGMSLANMQVGETWTLRDLLSLSMIQTAADACVTLAYTLCGSVDRFVLGMNAYAKQIGCTHSSFANVHGLDDPRQYTTARDLYIILRHALDYSLLEQLLGTPEYTVTPVSGESSRSWENTNYMLRGSSDYYYSPLTLGKTGVSEASGSALASVAEDGGYRYLTVVLGCPAEVDGSHYENTRTLYRWALNHLVYKTVVAKNQPVDRLPVTLSWDTDTVTLVAKNPLACLVNQEVDVQSLPITIVPLAEVFEAPIEKGAVLGKAELYFLEEKVGEVELVAGETVSRGELLYLWDALGRFLDSPWFWFSAGLFLSLIVVYMVVWLYRDRRKKQRARSVRR